MIPTLLSEEALKRICRQTQPEPRPDALAGCIGEALPGHHVTHLLTEENWYRIGGVVAADGTRIADSLEDWVAAESGGDLELLIGKHGDSGLLATAHAGRTHFFVAPTGDGPLDFLQIEVEEVAEIVDRPIFPADNLPESLEEVIDPLNPPPFEAKSLGRPVYQFRQAVLMSDLAGELTSEYTGDPGFRRFMRDWEESTAVESTRFCYQWVVTRQPYLTGTGDHVLAVRLLSPLVERAKNATPERLDPHRGLPEFMHDLGHRAGYPLAWFFLMIACRFLPYAAAAAVHRDLTGAGEGAGFLAERDMHVFGRWIEHPYYL